MFQYPAKPHSATLNRPRFRLILFNLVKFCFFRMTNVDRTCEFVSDRFLLFPNVERTKTFVSSRASLHFSPFTNAAASCYMHTAGRYHMSMLKDYRSSIE